MTRTLLGTVALGALIVVGTMASADRGGPHRDEHASFETLDQDGDGGISRAEMAAHRADRFARADQDGDGRLSVEELVARDLRRAQERAARLIERMDADGDGLLALDEMATEKHMARMFDRLDRDSDGAVSQSEYDAARAHMGEHRAHQRGGHHGDGHHGDGHRRGGNDADQ